MLVFTSSGVCCVQIQTLQQEKEHLSQEIEDVYRMHHEQLELQQLQHYQVGKVPLQAWVKSVQYRAGERAPFPGARGCVENSS